MKSMIALILSLVLHVTPGESVGAAVDSARTVYEARGEKTTILIEPGTYCEELTIDVPGLTLKNASKHPSIGLKNHGVDADSEAVRLTWYYGHGYQYRSMGSRVNYGGSRERLWNASVLVTAPDFRAEGIIFENSFNLYVCEKEAADSLVDISHNTSLPSPPRGEAPSPWRVKGSARLDVQWTSIEPLGVRSERPKKIMPVRPREVGSTEVQKKRYRERASAISFAKGATNAVLKNCRAVGRQDVLYGDEGATIYWQGGVLQGGVDFIFGGMTMVADHTTIIANITDEKGEKCYIAAGRAEPGSRGLLFYKCYIRSPRPERVWLARPWRSWGETVWAYTRWEKGKKILNPEVWSTGLIRKREEFNPDDPCPRSYEYKSQDKSKNRPAWVTILSKPQLPDGTKLTPKAWLK